MQGGAGKKAAGLTQPAGDSKCDLGAGKKGEGLRNQSGSWELSGSGTGALTVTHAPLISFNPQSKLARKLLFF